MQKIIGLSSLVLSLVLMGGCGDRTTPPEKKEEVFSVQSLSLNKQTHTITTDEDFKTVTLVGTLGSTAYINDKEVGQFPESGTLEVTLSVKEEGSYSYKMYSANEEGQESTPIMIEVLKNVKSATLGAVSTKGEANALTVSQAGIIFVAEKNHGVEIISIGFDDKVSSDLLSSIDTIDAENVILSDDEKMLYVEDKAGKYHVLDISDLSHPTEVDIIDQIEKSNSFFSSDKTMQYTLYDCGLVGEFISSTGGSTRAFLLEDEQIQDVVLVDDDTKLLIAHGEEGLQLIDLADVQNPVNISSKSLGDDTSGLSLLKRDGILFVANGASGVQIFDLDILLDEMTRK